MVNIDFVRGDNGDGGNKYYRNFVGTVRVPEQFNEGDRDRGGLAVPMQVEISQTITRMVGVLERALKPQGFNIGLNLGRAAGAGWRMNGWPGPALVTRTS